MSLCPGQLETGADLDEPNAQEDNGDDPAVMVTKEKSEPGGIQEASPTDP